VITLNLNALTSFLMKRHEATKQCNPPRSKKF